MERTSPMQFVDRALARRLEAAEEMPQVFLAPLYQQQRPEIGAASEPICGGHMIFAGLGSPVGRAVGLGLDRPLTAEDLDRVEGFYRSHHAPSQVDLTPVHEPAVFEMFKKRGYGIAELNNVLWRPLRPDESFPGAPPGVELRAGRPEEADSFADIVAPSFHETVQPPEGFHQMLAPLFQIPGVISFVASVNGVMAGVGAGLMIPEHHIVALFGAGTVPEFRRRGIQTAVLGVRLKLAAEAGCELAVVVTQGATVSQRNSERVGFRVAYSKVTVIKPT
jgi:GNAT superfamily N-acetyltransferase